MRPFTEKMTLSQIINNYACSKINFTQPLNNSGPRYIVSIKSIYKGNNPSQQYDLIIKIKDAINELRYNSIGGWYDTKNNIYCLDANLHFNDINNAINAAKIMDQQAIYDQESNKVIYVDYTKGPYK